MESKAVRFNIYYKQDNQNVTCRSFTETCAVVCSSYTIDQIMLKRAQSYDNESQ